MSIEVSDYYSRANPDLLALIPPDAKTVLEIGCGAGALCAAYKRMNPEVHWVGVDNHDMTDTSVDDLLHTDIEQMDFQADMGPFDVLVCGDVLEHLRDPWKVLAGLTRWLIPGAQVLASIPNVQHWTVIRDLLRGKWTYTDEGLLDRTHLRFFTLDSIREMFEQAGLQVFEIRGRDLCNEGHGGFFESMNQAGYGGCSMMEESILESFKIDPDEFNRRTRAYQYIVRAIKPRSLADLDPSGIEPMWAQVQIGTIPKLHIHAVLAEACCARPRILEPFAMLSIVPGVKCTSGTISHYADFSKANIVIQQRQRSIELEWQREMASRGMLLIAELDDEPEAIGVNPMALKAVHAVQVSTEPLAEIVRQWNPNVMVFENQIAELPAFIPDDSSGGTPNAGIFFGAQNREADWAPIIPALNRIASDPNVVVWFDVVHDRKFFDALETTAKRFHRFLPYDQYRTLLSTCDIALLPLESGRFNECKSDLKFLECAAEGVCCLMSWFAADWTMIHANDAYRFYSDANIFEDALRSLINNADERRETAKNAYAYVRDHRLLSQHFRKRLAWYQELLATKSNLDLQLWERVPELAPRDLIETPA